MWYARTYRFRDVPVLFVVVISGVASRKRYVLPNFQKSLILKRKFPMAILMPVARFGLPFIGHLIEGVIIAFITHLIFK